MVFVRKFFFLIFFGGEGNCPSSPTPMYVTALRHNTVDHHTVSTPTVAAGFLQLCALALPNNVTENITSHKVQIPSLILRQCCAN